MADPLSLAVTCVTQPVPATPQPINNPPGQPALRARIGNQPQFLAAMLEAIAARPALDGMRVAEGDDATLGLLDAWAGVLDTLTFYGERIANEGYLGTALERRSLAELARTIGYELAPGVATDALLAFTLDSAAAQAAVPGIAERMSFPPGLATQSIPGPGEDPQIFETLEPLVADVRWNAVGASRTCLPPMGTGSTGLWVDGLNGDLRPGDLLLLVGKARRADRQSDEWDARELTTVTLDAPGKRTHLTWNRPLGSAWPKMAAADPDAELEVWAMLGRTSLFGAHAPDPRSLHASILSQYGIPDGKPGEWPRFTIDGDHGGAYDQQGGGTVQLEGAPPLVKGQWLILQTPAYRELYQVEQAAESGVRAFTLTAKTTEATLSGENLSEIFGSALRTTTVFLPTRRLTVAEGPDDSDVSGATVRLERIVDGLAPGQRVAVSEALPTPAPGAPPAVPGPGEACVIASVETVGGRTQVTFAAPLSRAYSRAAFRLHGNVVRASHGRSIEQVLGSGDAGAAFQRFALAQAPLTFTSAATDTGVASSLEVRVNGVLWEEVPRILGQPADARVYISRRADDGTTSVIFGDGVAGARLPTGRENVVARYRVGIGLAGRVRDRQVSLLLSRPLGLTGVFNPAPATGGADPEARDQARLRAPATVRTLGRIVSLEDFADFARTFAGIGQARVDRVWTGHDWRVLLTVAAASGEALPAGHPLLATLAAAIDGVRDTTQPLLLADQRPRSVTLKLKLLAADGWLWADVAAAVRGALPLALGRAARALGAPLTLSAIVRLVHAVPGVGAVDIDVLRAGNEDAVAAGGLAARPGELAADGSPLGADLLFLDLLEVTEMQP